MARIDDLLAKCERPVSSTPARAAGRKIAAMRVSGEEWSLVAHGGMRPDITVTDPGTCREYARLCRAEADRLRFDHPELANALERRAGWWSGHARRNSREFGHARVSVGV